MRKFLQRLFGSTPARPIAPPVDPYSEEYLDLMLEWGTIADIPNLVKCIRSLKAQLREQDKHDFR